MTFNGMKIHSSFSTWLQMLADSFMKRRRSRLHTDVKFGAKVTFGFIHYVGCEAYGIVTYGARGFVALAVTLYLVEKSREGLGRLHDNAYKPDFFTILLR